MKKCSTHGDIEEASSLIPRDKSDILSEGSWPLSAAVFPEHDDPDAIPYAGLEIREIKSLSAEDIDELRRGGGWGLALPAELNGKPGPAHVLELSEELELTDSQIEQITVIFENMRQEAIAVGERLITAERELSLAFETNSIGSEELQSLVGAAEAARAELRVVHLSRHLLTEPLLTSEQINRYRVLRGYASNPCASVPSGHDPAMWMKHNNCG